jgi:putative FmdB family regulatory protein
MPIYEYACPEGHDRFEKLSPMAKGEAASCPICGKSSPRVVSMFSARVAVGAGVGADLAPTGGNGASCSCSGDCC